MRFLASTLPLKWQIQIWHGLVLAVVVSVLGVLFYKHERAARLNELENTLQQQIHPMMHAGSVKMGLFPKEEKPISGVVDRKEGQKGARKGKRKKTAGSWENMATHEDTLYKAATSNDSFENFERRYVPEGYYVIAWDPTDKKLIHRSSNTQGMTIPDINRRGFWRRSVKGDRREIFHSRPRVSMVIGRTMTSFEDSMATLRNQLIAGGVGMVILGVFVGSVFVSSTLKPIQRIRSAAASIAKGNLKQRIPKSDSGRSNEITKLSEDLNLSFEQLEQLFLRQRQFTADASHELRTPLTALLTHIQLGRSRERSVSEYSEILNVSNRSAERLKHIVDDLLEIFRYDSGTISLDIASLPAQVLIETLAEDLRPMIEAKGCSIGWTSSDCEINCDSFRIEQVITNLINNAIQHNSKPVDLSLNAYEVGANSIIEISDNGSGIQPKNLSRLFDRFYQEDESHSNGGKNIGMGLAISKAIVEEHGGTLVVTSDPYVKTVFTITIPKRVKE